MVKQGKIHRILRILMILQSGRWYATSDLAKMMGTSRRTIFRDLNDLKKLGIPCYYDKETSSYTIDSSFFMPSINLSTEEAMSLFILAYKASDHISFPFKNLAFMAAAKIENNLPIKIKQHCNKVLRNISVITTPQTEMELLDNKFSQLQNAILRKQIVKFYYYLSLEEKAISVYLEPYHLIHHKHVWHIIGKSNFHKKIRTFKLGQIKRLNVLDKCFLKDKEFDIFEYIGKAWAMVPEGRLYNIKLRFVPEIAHTIAEVKWHSTQIVRFEEDGSAIVEFRVDGLNEIIPWILSYGDQVQSLSPGILRKKILEISQKTLKVNQQLISPAIET